MDKLGDHLVGVFSGHHQLFSFRTEEGIDYLALHVEYVGYTVCAGIVQ